LASGTYPHRTTGGVPASIHLWDVISRKELREFLAHDQGVTDLAFSPDGTTLASCGSDVRIRLWNVATGNEINPSSAHRTGITDVVISPTDGVVITGGYDGTIRRWDPVAGRELGRLGPLPRPVHALAIAPGGRLLLSASLGGIGSLRLWDVATGREVHRLIEGSRGRRVGGLAFAPNGRLATADGKIWEVATGREIIALRERDGKSFSPWRPHSVLYTPDGKRLISASSDVVRLWDADTGREIGPITDPDLLISSIALSPDGRFVAGAGNKDLTVRLWHIGSGREVAQLLGQKDQTYALAFSPDGRLLAAGSGSYTQSKDQSVRVWELASGREVRRFDWHRAGVTGVAFLPDGRRLVSCSADATAIVWDVASTGRPPGPVSPAPLDLDRRWANLAGDDAAMACQTIWVLAAEPERVVTFLADRLKPINPDDLARNTSLGPIAAGETLRRLRAIAVLEKIATPEAHVLLERLASGLEGARETRDARAALRRHGGRP
jgi:WD40 repeat protein